MILSNKGILLASILKYVFLLFFVSCALSCARPDVREPTNSARDKAEMIQNCTQAHGMLRDNEIRTRKVNSYGEMHDVVDRFQFCLWPQTYYTNPDGYYDIVVRFERGPGEAHYTGVSKATYLKADCKTLRIYSSYGHMGQYEHYPPFTAEIGSVVEARGEIYDEREGAVYPYPDRDEVVLLTGHADLDRAECIQ